MEKEFIKAGYEDYNSIFLSWQLIDKCQYNCTYCSSVNYNLNTFSKKNYNVWKPFIKMLCSRRLGMPFSIELLGGEPTIHPGIYEIVEKLTKSENCTQVDMITNLAKSYNFYEKFYTEYSKNKLVVITSYHPQYHNNSFTEKIVKLNKANIKVKPSINLHDNSDYWDKTIFTLNTLDENNIEYNVNLLFEVEDGIHKGYKPNYTDEFFDKFNVVLKNKKLNTPCRLNKYGNPLKEGEDVNSNIDNLLTEGADILRQNVPYETKDKKFNFSEKEIVINDYAKFKGWKCKPMIYTVDMDCNIENSCTGEKVSFLNLTKKNLTKCVVCPLVRCDCSTKFLYPKYKE